MAALKNLKGLVWKSRKIEKEKEKKKKVIGTNSKVRLLHTMPLNGGVTKEI
jgi:hypothetical protein